MVWFELLLVNPICDVKMHWLLWICLGLTVTSLAAELQCENLSVDIEQDARIKTCTELAENLHNCWNIHSNIICKGPRAKRGCLPRISNFLPLCTINAPSEYLNRTVLMVQNTDSVLCNFTHHVAFKPICLQNARQTTQRQAQFLMDGYDTEDGCGYRTLHSLLSDVHSPDYEHCNYEMFEFRRLWYEFSPCNKYKKTFDVVYANKRGEDISPECLQIQSLVDDCYTNYSPCNEDDSKVSECFREALKNVDDCNEPLLRRNLKHRAETMIISIKLVCESDCHEFIRRWCSPFLRRLTFFAAAAVSDFHSPKSCKDRKLRMDSIVESSNSRCRNIISQFSDELYSMVNCRDMTSESFQPYEPQSHRPYPVTEFTESGKGNGNESVDSVLLSLIVLINIYF